MIIDSIARHDMLSFIDGFLAIIKFWSILLTIIKLLSLPLGVILLEICAFWNKKCSCHISKSHGDYVPCQGARGETFGDPDTQDYFIKGYKSTGLSFPPETVGSAKALGLDENTCFDRESRYSPYGLSDNHQKSKHIRWANTKWGALQDTCFHKNAERFAPDSRRATMLHPSRHMWQSGDPLNNDQTRLKSGLSGKRYKERTAILIRTWEGYEYRENDIQAIRALVTETALLSGGEYQVFLLPYLYSDIDDMVYLELFLSFYNVQRWRWVMLLQRELWIVVGGEEYFIEYWVNLSPTWR